MRLAGLWRRLRSAWSSAPNGTPPKAPAPVEASSRAVGAPRLGADLAVLANLDVSDPASAARAVSAFESLVASAREDAALAQVLELTRLGRCPTQLACVAARLLLARGEHELAHRLLEEERSAEALALLADVAAARGHLADALDLAERALAYDLDAAEARERMQRWGRKPAPRTPGGAQPTVLSRDLPETSLRIVGEAGRGGAATVYRARDDVLGRDVALKVYHRLESDRDKLVREARMAVSLAMPGVVQIFDVDPEHGFIAMEWVERGSVADALETGVAGEMHPAGGWFADLGKTLARIHERGFVHADLKPANVLLLNPARAIVSDFGLALPLGSRHLGASEGYVSPERQAGARASAEDDVFALGCILERVLDAVGQLRSEDLRGWRELSVHLTGGDRPCDAGELLRLLPPR